MFDDGKFESIFIETVKRILLLERFMESKAARSLYLENVRIQGNAIIDY